jgi:hypothetical protein
MPRLTKTSAMLWRCTLPGSYAIHYLRPLWQRKQMHTLSPVRSLMPIAWPRWPLVLALLRRRRQQRLL